MLSVAKTSLAVDNKACLLLPDNKACLLLPVAKTSLAVDNKACWLLPDKISLADLELSKKLATLPTIFSVFFVIFSAIFPAGIKTSSSFVFIVFSNTGFIFSISCIKMCLSFLYSKLII